MEGALESRDPLFSPSSRTFSSFCPGFNCPGRVGEPRDNAREEKKEAISYFILLFCPSESDGQEKKRSPHSPISEQSLRPLLPFFLSSLHLDLRRKWTFYETEITTLRQSEGLSSSRGQSQKREYFHLPTLDRLFNLVPGHRMTLLERLHSTCTIFIIFSEIGHSLFYLSALANRHGSGNGPSYISVFCAPPMIQHRRTVTT